MDDVLFLYTTWPDAAAAEAAGEAAVSAGLAACVNVFPPIGSIYRWRGAVERETETPATFKTTAAAAPALKAMILERHPYELPAILAFPAMTDASHPPFLDWIRSETAPAAASIETQPAARDSSRPQAKPGGGAA